jgi:hypothetical protein
MNKRVICKNCGWTQDPFWQFTDALGDANPHSPLDELGDLKGLMAKGLRGELQAVEVSAAQAGEMFDLAVDGPVQIHYTQFIASRLQTIAQRIGDMRWPTIRDYNWGGMHHCPVCNLPDVLEVIDEDQIQ